MSAQGSTQTQAQRLEAAVLGTLTARRWRMSADIADETGLPAPAVRLALRRLRDRGVLDRNIRGEWQIIAAEGAAGIGGTPR